MDGSPLFIGGVGGSGTRVVCEIVMNAGYFMGSNLNESLDSLDFEPFYDDCIRQYLETKPPNLLSGKFKRIFLECVAKQNQTKTSKHWGVKIPRFILVIPFLHSLYPKMKFIHIIRDGRDTAFSNNQNQIRLYGDIFCKDMSPNTPLYSLRYWSAVNNKAFEYGVYSLEKNYCLIRFEDLLERPKETIKNIIDFIDMPILDFSKLLSIIKPPTTVGMWQSYKNQLTKMTDFDKNTLKKFGYA